MPEYRATRDSGREIVETDIHLQIPVGGTTLSGQLLKSRLPDSNVTLYLVRQTDYFDRDGLYQSDGRDFPDNCDRFIFFCPLCAGSFSATGLVSIGRSLQRLANRIDPCVFENALCRST